MSRSRWEVVPAGKWLGWRVTYNGEDTRRFLRKISAVRWAASWCWHYWDTKQEQSELTIKGRDGRITDKRTYGADPVWIVG